MLYLSAIFLAFFLSFILFTKKNKSQADNILATWLIVLGFHLLTFYVIHSGKSIIFPTLAALGFPLPLAHGPLLFLYTVLQTSSKPLNRSHLFHFLPVILSYMLFGEFFILPEEQKVEIFRLEGQGFETHRLINLFAICMSGIIYVGLSLSRLLKYRRNLVHQFSNTEKIRFNWLLYLIIWIVVIWLVILSDGADNLIFGAASLFVIWIGYYGIRQVNVFSQHASEKDFTAPDRNKNRQIQPVAASLKYQKSSLSEVDSAEIHSRMNLLMKEQKPYLDPDLTLEDLAKLLEVHANTLSQVINSKENRNFYDLINSARIEEFIHQVSLKENQRYTLLAIAFKCGFNSKASFNRNFKKLKGHTPSAYLKSHALKVVETDPE